MAQRKVYFDPNFGLLLHNYLDNRAKFIGGNFNEAGFAFMEKGIPIGIDTFKRALTRNIPIVFGTDAVAGANGRNYEEFVYRVRDGGQKPMAAIVAATSTAAQSIELGDKIGTIAPGLRGRHHRDRRQPAAGHHGGAARRLRDEGRQGVQEPGDRAQSGHARLGGRGRPVGQ